jgi:hypothetical protein
MARPKKEAQPVATTSTEKAGSEKSQNTNIADFIAACEAFVAQVQSGGVADPVEASVVFINETLNALRCFYYVRSHNHPEIREGIFLLESIRDKVLALARDRSRRGKYGTSDL